MSFLEDIKRIAHAPWKKIAGRLGNESLSMSEVAGLLTDEAQTHLEELALAAHKLTVRRFGRTMKLYAPVYLSNECINGCLYCGFNSDSDIPRRTLSVDEAIGEAHAIMETGHRHILLVSGEHPTKVPVDFIASIAKAIRDRAAGISVEIQPLDESGYGSLVEAGVDGVTLYQETYDEIAYARIHPYGPKRVFRGRLMAIDAAGRAGMRFLGIGALLGLTRWRFEALALVAHARELIKKYWRSSITISVPRLRDSNANFAMPEPVSDRDMAHMICALRLALPDCGIALSTREAQTLRDNLLPLGITQMSAGSVTSPGGYTHPQKTGEQFHLEDVRSPDAVARMLIEAGYDPVWKDWDGSFVGQGADVGH